MNALPIALLSLGLATGASVATVLVLSPEPEAVEAASTAAPEELVALRQQVSALQAELMELRARRSADALPPAGASSRVDSSAIDAAVARYFQEHARAMPLEGASLADATPAAKEQESSAADLLELLEGAEGEDGRQEVWDRIREEGRLDDVIALLEARAEEFSDDPDAQVEVASAYIQKIFEVGEGPAAGVWAGKADKAYDRALALDDHHWDARFNKAISLSFWPPIFGKQREAISHFETLIEQQRSLPSENRHAQTYLLLGNLYAQSGDGEQAEATWQQGLGLFPENESLLGKIGDQ